MHLNEFSTGPLMCVSLSESLVLDDYKTEGDQVGNGIFISYFTYISRLLVPLARTLPLCKSLLKWHACVRAYVCSQACGHRGRLVDRFCLLRPDLQRKWKSNSVNQHPFDLNNSYLHFCFSSWFLNKRLFQEIRTKKVLFCFVFQKTIQLCWRWLTMN